VGRATLEVADIFREFGPAWRQAQRGHLSLDQLKVMSAIEHCRSAALGGHVLRCEGCGTDQIAYNSCLMVSVPLRGVRWSKWHQACAGRLFDSPLRLGLQHRNESVRWPELAFAKVRRYDCFDGLQLLAGVGPNVDLRGGQGAVAQP